MMVYHETVNLRLAHMFELSLCSAELWNFHVLIPLDFVHCRLITSFSSPFWIFIKWKIECQHNWIQGVCFCLFFFAKVFRLSDFRSAFSLFVYNCFGILSCSYKHIYKNRKPNILFYIWNKMPGLAFNSDMLARVTRVVGSGRNVCAAFVTNIIYIYIYIYIYRYRYIYRDML